MKRLFVIIILLTIFPIQAQEATQDIELMEFDTPPPSPILTLEIPLALVADPQITDESLTWTTQHVQVLYKYTNSTDYDANGRYVVYDLENEVIGYQLPPVAYLGQQWNFEERYKLNVVPWRESIYTNCPYKVIYAEPMIGAVAIDIPDMPYVDVYAHKVTTSQTETGDFGNTWFRVGTELNGEYLYGWMPYDDRCRGPLVRIGWIHPLFEIKDRMISASDFLEVGTIVYTQTAPRTPVSEPQVYPPSGFELGTETEIFLHSYFGNYYQAVFYNYDAEEWQLGFILPQDLHFSVNIGLG